MEKLDCHIPETSSSVNVTLREMQAKINELVVEVNMLKLSKQNVQRITPDEVNPYDVRARKKVKRKSAY